MSVFCHFTVEVHIYVRTYITYYSSSHKFHHFVFLPSLCTYGVLPYSTIHVAMHSDKLLVCSFCFQEIMLQRFLFNVDFPSYILYTQYVDGMYFAVCESMVFLKQTFFLLCAIPVTVHFPVSACYYFYILPMYSSVYVYVFINLFPLCSSESSTIVQ